MPLVAQSAVILQYHHVSSETPAITSLSTEKFNEHMQYLKENSYNVVPLPQLMTQLKNNQPIKDKTVVITFDDGYDNVYHNARPILKALDWPYTIFVNPKFIDDKYKRHMTWQQLNELAKEGATIANHTMDHQYLVRQPAELTKEQWLKSIEKDIKLAELRIKTETGQNHKMIAYPYGEFDLSIKQMLKNTGFTAFGQHSGAINANTDMTRIPRFPASGIYANLQTLKVKLASLPFTILSLKNANPVIAAITQNPPTLTVKLKVKDFTPANLNCFAGSAHAQVKWVADDQFSVTSPKPLPKERSRYNCTAPSLSKPGRFYWFSQPWVNLI